jgi:hypothetical protein
MAKRDTEEHRRKSGSISRDRKNGTVTVSLRIPIGMLKEIDAALKERPYRMPRHLWLLEAIHEKLAGLNRRQDSAGVNAHRER